LTSDALPAISQRRLRGLREFSGLAVSIAISRAVAEQRPRLGRVSVFERAVSYQFGV
jgi:hypothetical protein